MTWQDEPPDKAGYWLTTGATGQPILMAVVRCRGKLVTTWPRNEAASVVPVSAPALQGRRWLHIPRAFADGWPNRNWGE